MFHSEEGRLVTKSTTIFDQEEASMMQEGDRMGPGSVLEGLGEKRWDRASGMEPGQYGRESLKRPRKSAHCGCQEFNFLFLW